jgi:poly(3-hydroxybutyrate) depolymerase
LLQVWLGISFETEEFHKVNGGAMNYRKFLIPAFIVSIVTAGVAQSTVTKVFTVNGTSHSCVWHVPSGITKPPVVFFIHGANGSGAAFQRETKGDVVADREKFIAVYPSASSNGNAGVWADMSGTTNFPFFLAVLDTLDKRYQIDRSKIYMTGFSQGGFISFVAGCSYSNIFAAIAPVSGHAGSKCTLKRPVPVFLTFGAQEDKAAFVKDLNIWLNLDSCTSTPTITRPYTGVSRISYEPCAQGSYVVMDSISGQNHQWPTKQNQAEEVWKFFKQFSLKNTTAAGKQRPAVAAAHESISASYLSGIVCLRGVGENIRVKVINTQGRQVASAAQGQFAFTHKPSGVYIVMVRGNDRSVALKMVLP